MAFRGLQNEANAQAQAHKAIASDLEGLVVKPFDEWATGYKVLTTLIDHTSPHHPSVPLGAPWPEQTCSARHVDEDIRAESRRCREAEAYLSGKGQESR